MMRINSGNVQWLTAHFQWIGLCFALIIFLLLLVDAIRSGNLSLRFNDIKWLSWLGIAIYLLHNVEEYGLDILGLTNSFPHQARILLQTINPNGALPGNELFAVVNITAFWFVCPIATFRAKRYPLTGMAIFGIMSVNGLIHLLAVLSGKGWSAGNFTGVVFFIPLSSLAFYVYSRHRNGWWKGLAVLLACGILTHLILAASFLLYLYHLISYSFAIWIAGLNAFVFLAIIFIKEKFWIQKRIILSVN